jgi:glc operon protein GlcG
MPIRVIAAAVICTLLLGAMASHAQQQAAPAQQQAAPAQQANPLDVVPETMPFDVPYGTPISLSRAQIVISAAVAEAAKRGWKLTIAVVDPGGNLVAFSRMDGSQLASIAISEHKARAAVTFRRETKVFENAVQNGFVYVLSLDGVVASRGGIPLVEGGKMVGAIGVSGGTGSQDEVAAKAGVAALSAAAAK